MFLTFDFREKAGGVRTGFSGESQVGSAGAIDLREECREHPGVKTGTTCSAERHGTLSYLVQPEDGT